MALSPALWIHLAASLIAISAANRHEVPVACRGSVRKFKPVSEIINETVNEEMNEQSGNSLSQTYYRFYCEITRTTSQKFDVFHEFTKKPFTRLDCKQSGCNYSAWNEMVGNRRVIIDAEWGISEQYAITVVQLKICKVPADHNVNRIVTVTRSEFNNAIHCKGFKTLNAHVTQPSHYMHWKSLEDHYVHLTSDMITTQEDLIKVNSGHRLVIHTHLDRCRTFSPECDFDLWMPLNLDCNFYDHITNTTVDLYFDTITYSDGSSKLIIARRRKMVKYNMLFRERFSTTVLYAQPVFIQSRCRYPTDDPTSFLVDTNRRVKVLTLYWPNITIGNTDGATKRIGDNFYTQPDQQTLKFYIMIVSTEELLYLKINRTDKEPEEGEITINKLFRNSLNYTTMYTLTLSKFDRLTKNLYKIEAAVRASFSPRPANSSLIISIIILTEIRMAINPSYAVVVRGDKSSKPWFLCVAVGYPTPTIEWSGISSLYDANQVPANESELPKGYVGAYLQFPSADRLGDHQYSGEYICTVSDPVLGTKQATAIFMVFEPGSSYDIFKRYVSNKQEMEDEEEEIEDLTDDEISLLRHLKSPFITEAHKAIKENVEVATTSLLALLVGIIVLVSLTIWVIIKTCRRCKQLKGYRWLKKKKRPAACSKKD